MNPLDDWRKRAAIQAELRKVEGGWECENMFQMHKSYRKRPSSRVYHIHMYPSLVRATIPCHSGRSILHFHSRGAEDARLVGNKNKHLTPTVTATKDSVEKKEI